MAVYGRRHWTSAEDEFLRESRVLRLALLTYVQLFALFIGKVSAGNENNNRESNSELLLAACCFTYAF